MNDCSRAAIGGVLAAGIVIAMAVPFDPANTETARQVAMLLALLVALLLVPDVLAWMTRRDREDK